MERPTTSVGILFPCAASARRVAVQKSCVVFAIGILLTAAPFALAQLSTLDKGHRLIVNDGLQVWGFDSDTQYTLSYNELTLGKMTGVMFGTTTDMGPLSPGDKWGKWVDYHSTPSAALNASETAHQNDLLAIQVGDEQGDIETPGGYTANWFAAAHAGNYFPNSLLYTNSFFINSQQNYANFLINSNPDAISWDSYPFSNGTGSYITPQNWLALGNIFRRQALGAYIGATGASPRPYGMYVQTFHDSVAEDPGEAQIRWQQFTAWTMGYSFVDAFIYTGGNNNFGGQPNGPVFQAFQETARQGRNLGPALTHLISYGYGPSFIQGAGSSGIPGEWITFDRNNAQASQRYLTSITNVTNLGTKNGGLSGDVYVGFYNPLHLSFGDPTETTYFMVMNGLGGDLRLPDGSTDNTATVAQTRQQMTLNFDFGITGINSLLRLNRNTGQVDTITTGFSDGGNTVFTSLGGGKYQLQLTLDGGTGDLFKYNDGTPFVGVQAAPALGYWDADANAANNDVASGAGLGGSGQWDVGSKWYNGTSNSAFSANSNVVFAGAPGTVTVVSPRAVTSMEFKSTGFTIGGAAVTLTAPTIVTDAGVTATISAPIAGTAGLIKNGTGTLNLTSASSTYTGNTTINEGVLSITSDAALGAIPGAATPNVELNNGATLRFGAAGIALSANREIVMGDGGGVLDTNGNDYTMAGVVSGGTLTKAGSGTLSLTASNTNSALAVTGGVVVVSADANLGAAPASFTAGNLTLDGGTLRFGGNFDIDNHRGIMVGGGGGTMDTQGFTNPSGYNAFQGGFTGPGELTKVGSGTFFAAATTGGANSSWKGKLILREGVWKIVASDGLPYNVPLADGLQAAQTTFDGGTLQMGATINVTNGRRGMTVASGGGTIDTQENNFTWTGGVYGTDSTAVLNKTGSGQLQFNTPASVAAGNFPGTFNIEAGPVVFSGGGAFSTLASVNLANAAGVSLTISGGAETIGSLGGGGTTGGNVTLNSNLITGGNNGSTEFDGMISGSGILTKMGTGTFTLGRASGNGYTGGTIVSGGTLLVNNTSNSGTGTGQVMVNSGGTLGGSGYITGAVMINSGGHIAPGGGLESLDVGSLSLAAGSALEIELATIGGVDTSDWINVDALNGLAINGGTLNIVNSASMTGGFYTLIDYAGSFTGSLANLSLGTAPGGFGYRLFNDAGSHSIRLEVTAPGDFNHDGVVDTADFAVWKKGFGTKYTLSDYDSWRSHFGQTYTVGSGVSASAVPEPAACLLMAAGGILYWMSGRRRNY